MALNIPVLLMTLGYIEENPHTWTQSAWRALPVDHATGKAMIQESTRCGANLCFAGHAAMLTGAKWEVSKPDLVKVFQKYPDIADTDTYNEHKHNLDRALAIVKTPESMMELADEDEGEIGVAKHPITGEEIRGLTAGGWARIKLGLSERQAHELFDGENSLNVLRSYVLTWVMEEMQREGTWVDYSSDVYA